MNTGQLMITVGALMLLSLVILRVNNSFLSTSTVLLNSKFGVLAVSLGTSIIEEANSKAFDEVTDTVSISSVSSLSAVTSLGPESGEVYPNYNDFDDFNGYTRTTAGDSTFQSAVFNVNCNVRYILPSDPNVSTSAKTWHKRITVTVSSPSMVDTVRLYSIFSYWYFR
jgi:hypothetical protein